MDHDDDFYTLFCAGRELAHGPLAAVLPTAKELFDRDPGAPLLIFQDPTGQQCEFDLHGSLESVLGRELPSARTRGPGRPRMGVVSREVSLLPRHWEFLESQPSGISGALRRLVEEAIKREPGKERARRRLEGTAKVMTALAGNAPGFEEALRALYASDFAAFAERIAAFEPDVRAYLLRGVAAIEQLTGAR
jgi:uncharacterized protein